MVLLTAYLYCGDEEVGVELEEAEELRDSRILLCLGGRVGLNWW